jgi:hypothetical protein
MGLDMYLSAVKYESNYSFQKKESGENERFNTVLSAFPNVKISEHSPSLEVSFTVGYWRKANAIHAWFVNNCGKGVDECQEMYVSHEHLLALKEECLKVLSSDIPVKKADESARSINIDGTTDLDIGSFIASSMAIESTQIGSEPVDDLPLPPVAGFFFGSTERDEWYFNDIRETLSLVNDLIRDYPDEDGWRFSYRASW